MVSVTRQDLGSLLEDPLSSSLGSMAVTLDEQKGTCRGYTQQWPRRFCVQSSSSKSATRTVVLVVHYWINAAAVGNRLWSRLDTDL
jgi:hypothetical protein